MTPPIETPETVLDCRSFEATADFIGRQSDDINTLRNQLHIALVSLEKLEKLPPAWEVAHEALDQIKALSKS